MSGLKQWIRNNILAGLAFLTPIALTIYILELIFSSTDKILNLVPEVVRPNITPFPGLGLLVAVILCLICGIVIRNFIGNFFLRKLHQIVDKIPVIAAIYSLFRQVADTFLSTDKTKGFKRVVLVEFPRKDAWTIGFETSEMRENHLQLLTSKTGSKQSRMVSVFVPTTPNPTSGFLFYVNESETIPLDLSVDAGFKLIVSGGTIDV